MLWFFFNFFQIISTSFIRLNCAWRGHMGDQWPDKSRREQSTTISFMIVISVTQLAVHHKQEWKPESWLPLNWVEARLLKPHESQRSLFFFSFFLEPWREVAVSCDERLWGCWPFFPVYPQSPLDRRGKEIRPNTNQTSAFYLLRLGPVIRGRVKTKEADDTPCLTSTRTVFLWLSLTSHTSKTKRTESTLPYHRGISSFCFVFACLCQWLTH